MTSAELHAAVSRLAGEPVAELITVRGGGNNRLYRASGAARSYAVKRYPDDPADARSRFVPEYGGLTFLWENGIRTIPQPIGLDVESGIGVYAWVTGEPAVPADPGDGAALAAFAARLHAARTVPGAAELPPAREAVTSEAQLYRQLEMRLDRLAGVAAGHPALAVLLAEITAEVARRRPSAPDTRVLERSIQTLSPSDFGLHNALRTPAGLTFLDFEYFGWDDPVKLVSDVLWHPGMALDESERQMFYRRAADVYEVDVEFADRFKRDVPLYGLRWALIVLNEFLPAAWQRRVDAGQTGDRTAVLALQLAKSGALLDRVRRNAVLA